MKRARSKLITGLVLLVILTIVFGVVFSLESMGVLIERDLEDSELKGIAVRDAIEDIDRITLQINEDLEKKNLFRLSLIAVSLREKGEKEQGALQPAFYGDGFLFLLDENGLHMPENYPDLLRLEPEEISGDSGSVFLNMQQNPETGEVSATFMYYVRVTDNCFYAEWDILSANSDESADLFDSKFFLKGIEKTFNTDIIVIANPYSADSYMDGMISYSSDGLPKWTEPAQYGFTEEKLARAVSFGGKPEEAAAIVLGDNAYALNAYELKGSHSLVCLLSPLTGTFFRAVELAAVGCLIFAVIGITFLTWIFNVFVLVRDHDLTEEQKNLFRPQTIRKRALMFAAGTAAVLFLVALYTGCLSGLYSRSATVDRALDVLEDQMANRYQRQQIAGESRTELYLQHASLIRDILVQNPSLQTQDDLAEMNRLIGTDYIILYDQDGREMLCSKNLYGLELGEDEESSMYEFRKLLRGIETVSLVPAVDELTGLERELYGVTFPLEDVDDGCGALLLAVDPARTPLFGQEDTDSVMRMLVAEGRVCFAVDEESGRILHASDSSIVGKDAAALGFPEEAKRDGYKGFYTFNGRQRYAATLEKDGVFYCYAADKSNVYSGAARFAAVAGGCSFLCMLLLAAWMLAGYKKGFERYSDVGKELEEDDIREIRASGRWIKFSVDPSRRWGFARRKYGTRAPAHYAVVVLTIQFIIVAAVLGTAFLRRRTDASAGSSVLGYMLSGQWARGVNLFALTNIFLLLFQIGVLVIVSRFVLQVLGSVLGTKGETICRLLLNMVSYVGVIVFLFVSLSYLGIDTATLLASLGLATFALSLGLRDLVTDVVAGIFIVFEGEYQVGDIIEVAGYRGKVIEIGVRTTKLEGRGGNIKIIGNRDMKNVVNMTRKNSWYAAELTLSADTPVGEIESILDSELPGIGGRISEIISGPVYKGIIRLGGGTMTLSIIAECNEVDYHTVQRELNRELQEMCERHGIRLK